MEQQISLGDINPEYRAFVDKFKPKKTTDDCYTPDNIYDAVANWVSSEYGIRREDMVRPFWPGGDYERFDYPDGCCVVDNPPFSINAKIQRFYLERGIQFFLFAPTLTLFQSVLDVTQILCGVDIVYENGAKVNTSFVTNLDDCRVRSAPKLYAMVDNANSLNRKKLSKNLPKYIYPNNVVTAANLYAYSKHGIEWRLQKSECVRIMALDAQKAANKTIFGSGYLISDKAAADKAAADKKAADKKASETQPYTTWELSERERQIIASLGSRRDE